MFLLVHPLYRTLKTLRGHTLSETRHEGLPLVLDTSVTILSLSTRADFVVFHNLDTIEAKVEVLCQFVPFL